MVHTIVSLLMIPLVLLNALGGLASGIWLAVLGEWWALGYGLIALLVVHSFLFLVILVPGMLCFGSAGVLLSKGRDFLAFPLALLGYSYICVLITLWCVLTFGLFMGRATSDTFWPLLIWSYGVALGPWQYMAQKEEQASGGGDASTITTFFAQIAYIAMSLVLVFGRPTLAALALVFGAIMFLGLVIQTGIGFALLRREQRCSAPPRTTEQLMKQRLEPPGYMDDAGRVG